MARAAGLRESARRRIRRIPREKTMNHSIFKHVRIWLAALGCTLCAGAALAQDGAARPFAVWAIGLPHGFVTMEHQVSSIEVTADDVARGEVRVRHGSRIVITTRRPASHAVEFRNLGTFARSVSIEGFARAVEVETSGVALTHAVAARQVFELGYRFVLTPEVVPGTYAWPLEIAVRRPFQPVAAR
jgi:hypothetical protein